MTDETRDDANTNPSPSVTDPWASPPATDAAERPNPKGPLWKTILLWGVALLVIVLTLLLWSGTLP